MDEQYLSFYRAATLSLIGLVVCIMLRSLRYFFVYVYGQKHDTLDRA